MSFEKLVEQMDTLAKAQAASGTSIEDNKKIAAAAKEGAVDGQNNDSQTNADTGAGGDGLAADGIATTGKDKPMAKSFVLTLEDGTSVEAFDGTELVKSLTTRLEQTETELAAEKTSNQTLQTNVLKSLEVAVTLISGQAEALKSQGQLIKSLTEKVTTLGNEGRGARSVQTAVDPKAQLAKSLNGGSQELTSNEILAKSMVAMKAGRISGIDATRIETSLNMGVPVPADLLSTITSN